jgi:hypothetical protein
MSKTTDNSEAPPRIDHYGDVSVVHHADGRTLLLRDDNVEQLGMPVQASAIALPADRYWDWAAWAAVGLSLALAGWELAQQSLPRWRPKLARLIRRVTPQQHWAKLWNLRRHLEFVYGLKRASAPAPAHPGAQSSPRRKS